jgi:phenylalanyl-tRNA synthetase beta subunit
MSSKLPSFYFLEVNLKALSFLSSNKLKASQKLFSKIYKNNDITRDISIFTENNQQNYHDFCCLIQQSSDRIVNFYLIDLYPQIEYLIYTFRIHFNDHKQILTENDIEKEMQLLYDQLHLNNIKIK